LGISATLALDGMVLKDVEDEGRVVARWEVPWGLWKPVAVQLQDSAEEVAVWTGDYDPRSQEFKWRGARYSLFLPLSYHGH